MTAYVLTEPTKKRLEKKGHTFICKRCGEPINPERNLFQKEATDQHDDIFIIPSVSNLCMFETSPFSLS